MKKYILVCVVSFLLLAAGCAPAGVTAGTGTDNSDIAVDAPSVAVDPDQITAENYEGYIEIEEIPAPNTDEAIPTEVELLMQEVVQQATLGGGASMDAERLIFGVDDNDALFMLATTSDGILVSQQPFARVCYEVFIKAARCTLNGDLIEFDGENIKEGSVLTISVELPDDPQNQIIYKLAEINGNAVTEEQILEIREKESKACEAIIGTLSRAKVMRTNFSAGMVIGASGVIESAYQIWDGRSQESFQKELITFKEPVRGYSEITTYVYTKEPERKAVLVTEKTDGTIAVYNYLPGNTEKRM